MLRKWYGCSSVSTSVLANGIDGPASKRRYDYGVALLLLGFLATLAGQLGAHWLMTRLRRRYVPQLDPRLSQHVATVGYPTVTL